MGGPHRRGDASLLSQVMKAGGCCAVIKRLRERECGPCGRSEALRATSHQRRVVVFMKGALTESPLTRHGDNADNGTTTGPGQP